MKISSFKPQFLALALGLLGTSFAVQANEDQSLQPTGSLVDQAALITLSQKLEVRVDELIAVFSPEEIIFCDGFEEVVDDFPDNCYFGGVIPSTSNAHPD